MHGRSAWTKRNETQKKIFKKNEERLTATTAFTKKKKKIAAFFFSFFSCMDDIVWKLKGCGQNERNQNVLNAINANESDWYICRYISLEIAGTRGMCHHSSRCSTRHFMRFISHANIAIRVQTKTILNRLNGRLKWFKMISITLGFFLLLLLLWELEMHAAIVARATLYTNDSIYVSVARLRSLDVFFFLFLFCFAQ